MQLPTDCLPSDKLAFTIPEWGRATGRSRSATYDDLREGRLKAKKAGRRTIILREEGMRFLNDLPDYGAEAEAA